MVIAEVWEVSSIFDYGPLWETMQRQGVTQYQLLKSGIDNKTRTP